MTDYTELVKALRCKRDDCEGCDLAFFDKDEGWMCRYAAKDDDAADAIEALQAQLPKRGEWVEENRRPRSSQFVCSECHRTAYDPQPTRDKAWRKRCRYAYCPNCGSLMVGENDERN